MVNIYILTDPRSSVPRYVGKTVQDLTKRLNKHICERTKATTHKNSWIISLKENGFNPKIELIDIVPKIEWEFWEIYWISQFKTWGFNLTNGTLGGEGGNGSTGSRGYKHTIEAKKRISEANSKPRSKVHVENQSKSRYKAVEAWKDGVLTKTYDSATTAALSMGDKNKKKNISSCAKGNRKSAYGYVWKFKV